MLNRASGVGPCVRDSPGRESIPLDFRPDEHDPPTKASGVLQCLCTSHPHEDLSTASQTAGRTVLLAVSGGE